jgi:tetratricopeptide (TPR) repeat protein
MDAEPLMELRVLADLIPILLVERKFEDADARLQEARTRAVEAHDSEALELVLSMLVQLYCAVQPPDPQRAERYSREREEVHPSAYNNLQTSMVLYYVARDYERAAAEIQHAIELAQDQHDDAVRYSALSLLGQTLLKLNDTAQAADLLPRIQDMILTGTPLPITDVTTFLEDASAQGIEPSAVRAIANLSLARCRDEEMIARLRALVQGG